MNHKHLLLIALIASASRAGNPASDEIWEYEGEATGFERGRNYTMLGGLFTFTYKDGCKPDEPLLAEFWNDQNFSKYFGCSGEALAAKLRLVADGNGDMGRPSGYDSFEEYRRAASRNKSSGLLDDIGRSWSCKRATDARAAAEADCKQAAYPVQRKLRFTRASGSGHGWVIETIATARPLGYYFYHGRPEILARGTLYLDNCDNIPVARDLNPQQLPLPTLIANFEEIDFKNFWQCTLKVSSTSIVLKQALVRAGYSSHVEFTAVDELTVTVVPEGEIYLVGSKEDELVLPTRSQYKPTQTKHVDEARRQLALNGAANFVNLLREHGRLIARNGLAGASKGEIQRLAAESLAVRKAQMMRELAALNDNYSQLSLIDRLSVSASVERAYKYFQAIETRVAKLVTDNERLNLDKLVGAAAAKSSAE